MYNVRRRLSVAYPPRLWQELHSEAGPDKVLCSHIYHEHSAFAPSMWRVEQSAGTGKPMSEPQAVLLTMYAPQPYSGNLQLILPNIPNRHRARVKTQAYSTSSLPSLYWIQREIIPSIYIDSDKMNEC